MPNSTTSQDRTKLNKIVKIDKIPKSIKLTNSWFFQDEFEGCHAVLLNNDVVLTTAQCIQEHGGDPEPIFVVPGMYDERKYRNNQNPRLANENFKYVEFKNVDNHQKIYSDLALLRLKSPMNSQVFPALQVANFIPIPEGKSSNSKKS